MMISNFQNFTSPPEDTTIQKAIEAIKNGQFKDQITKLRKLKKGDSEYDRLKKKLPHFTPSGSFISSRKTEALYEYSQCVILDIDNVKKPQELLKKVQTDSYTHFAFLSPSGQGIKVGIKVDSAREYHEIAFSKLLYYFEQKYKEKVDKSGKDVARACFYSFDPDAYFASESKVFKIDTSSVTQKPNGKKSFFNPSQESPNMEIFEKIAAAASRDFEEKGKEGRNNHCYYFACVCNRQGLDRKHAIEFFLNAHEEPDFTAKEIRKTINGAYESNAGEFGSEISSGGVKLDDDRQKWQKRQSLLETGPDFSQGIYDNVPDLLKTMMKLSPVEELNGMVLFGSIVALSSIFPKCYVRSGGKKYHPNLFGLFLAPAASGKGTLTNVVECLESVDEKIRDGDYDKKLKKGDDPRGLFIAGDTSKAGLVEQLDQLENPNLLYDSEIDSTSSSMKQDWGDFSDVLRKVYEHETVFSKRKKKDQKKIRRPALSALMAGTPKQIKQFNADVENGLTSRLTVFSFETGKYIRESDRVNIDSEPIIKDADAKTLAAFDHNLKFPFELKFSTEQVKKTDDFFEELFNIYKDQDALRAAAVRLRIVYSRIALTLSCLEKATKKDKGRNYNCTDKIHDLSMSIVEVLWEHQLCAVKYQGVESITFKSKNKEILFSALPDCFTSADIYEAAKNVIEDKIPRRTLRSWREKWQKDGYIIRKGHGEYCKSE